MAEKDVARDVDLQGHIRTDYIHAHGIWAMVKSLMLAKATFYKNGVGQISKLLVQCGSSATTVGGTTITFDIPFAAAPVIVSNCSSNQTYTGSASSITATNFVGRCYDHVTTAGKAGTVGWVAIGERP